MGLVTSLSGAGSLAIPLVAGAVLGASITPAPAGRRRVHGGGRGGRRRGVARTRSGVARSCLAAAAALGFGAWYVLLDLAARGGDPLWALVFSRATSAQR